MFNSSHFLQHQAKPNIGWNRAEIWPVNWKLSFSFLLFFDILIIECDFIEDNTVEKVVTLHSHCCFYILYKWFVLILFYPMFCILRNEKIHKTQTFIIFTLNNIFISLFKFLLLYVSLFKRTNWFLAGNRSKIENHF